MQLHSLHIVQHNAVIQHDLQGQQQGPYVEMGNPAVTPLSCHSSRQLVAHWEGTPTSPTSAKSARFLRDVYVINGSWHPVTTLLLEIPWSLNVLDLFAFSNPP